MEVLDEFVSNMIIPVVLHKHTLFVLYLLLTKLMWRIDKFMNRFKKSRILPWTRPIFTIFNGPFDCYQFFATFCKHSTQISKRSCLLSMNTFSKKWWHVLRTAPVCEWKIGLPIYLHTKLAINSLVSFRTFWMEIQNCALSKTRHGEFTISHAFWRHVYSIEKWYKIFSENWTFAPFKCKNGMSIN